MVFDADFEGGLRLNSADDGGITSALLRDEVMVVATESNDAALSRSGSSKDSVIVEISDTAHQISQGFSISAPHTVILSSTS